MQPIDIKENKNFIGRVFELGRLSEIAKQGTASIIVAYGRRRVGKTELLEQAFRKRHIIKFEGLEGQNETRQRASVLLDLANYTNDSYIAKLQFDTWREVFELIADRIGQQEITLYFEEVQWLAHYKPEFISELKHVWDNKFKNNDKLIMILCGSSPSFMVSNILQSKSLYNRSQYEVPLKSFTLHETQAFLAKHSSRNVMDAYLTVGGVPEYLKQFKTQSSIFLALCRESFIPGGFFTNEYKRIFTSNLSGNKHYKSIIDFLSKRKFATRIDIQEYLKVKSSGALTDILNDLEVCGFINKYSPFSAGMNSKQNRFRIADNYLQFYFKFIAPKMPRIEDGSFQKSPSSAIKADTYQKWLGFAFERMCLRHHQLIADKLKFSAVNYRVGSYFSRATDRLTPGFQIDLIYERDDRVYTICEIKYLKDKVKSSVIKEFEEKLSLFDGKKNYSIHKVLITAEGADNAVINSGYFDEILSLDDFFVC